MAVGTALEEIVDTARDRHVYFIVMDVRSAGPVANHLPWTVVHSVVWHARCPVLTVRGVASGSGGLS